MNMNNGTQLQEWGLAEVPRVDQKSVFSLAKHERRVLLFGITILLSYTTSYISAGQSVGVPRDAVTLSHDKIKRTRRVSSSSFTLLNNLDESDYQQKVLVQKKRKSKKVISFPILVHAPAGNELGEIISTTGPFR